MSLREELIQEHYRERAAGIEFKHFGPLARAGHCLLVAASTKEALQRWELTFEVRVLRLLEQVLKEERRRKRKEPDPLEEQRAAWLKMMRGQK